MFFTWYLYNILLYLLFMLSDNYNNKNPFEISELIEIKLKRKYEYFKWILFFTSVLQHKVNFSQVYYNTKLISQKHIVTSISNQYYIVSHIVAVHSALGNTSLKKWQECIQYKMFHRLLR